MCKKYLSPLPSITAPELCTILCHCNNFYLACHTGIVFKSIEEFDKLPRNVQRHFTDRPTQ
jgi:hypothetical protein